MRVEKMRFPDGRRLRVALFAEPWTIELDADLREVLGVPQASLIGATHNEQGALGVLRVKGKKVIRMPVALVPDCEGNGIIRVAIKQAAAFLYKRPRQKVLSLAPTAAFSLETT